MFDLFDEAILLLDFGLIIEFDFGNEDSQGRVMGLTAVGGDQGE